MLSWPGLSSHERFHSFHPDGHRENGKKGVQELCRVVPLFHLSQKESKYSQESLIEGVCHVKSCHVVSVLCIIYCVCVVFVCKLIYLFFLLLRSTKNKFSVSNALRNKLSSECAIIKNELEVQ